MFNELSRINKFGIFPSLILPLMAAYLIIVSEINRNILPARKKHLIKFLLSCFFLPYVTTQKNACQALSLKNIYF